MTQTTARQEAAHRNDDTGSVSLAPPARAVHAPAPSRHSAPGRSPAGHSSAGRAVARPAAAGAALRPGRLRQWLGLIVLMLPVLLVSIDTTVLNFALPDLSEALRPSGVALLWIIDVYPLVLAALLVLMGSLADRFGRRSVLLIGSSGFVVVSVLAAFAPSAGWLIAARAALGLFGATLMPSTMSLLRSLFTDRGRRRLAIAVWGSAFGGGAALGPIVGGVLLDHFWWGSVFLLAAPMLAPLLIFLPLLVPESRDSAPGRIDLVSVVLSLAAMAPFVYGIKTLATHGAGVLDIACILVGAGSGLLFVRRQLRRRTPMFDVRLFADPAFSASIVINLLSLMAFTGALFFAAQQLQLVFGLPATPAGAVLAPGMVATMLAGLLVVPLARRVRPAWLVMGGMALAAGGYALMSASAGGHSIVAVAAAFVAVGFGVGSAETITNELILSTPPVEKTGAASAVSETAYEVGAVLGTAILGTLVTVAYRFSLALPAGLAHGQQTAARQTIGGAASVAGSLPRLAGERVMAAAAGAFQTGVGITAAVAAALVAIAAVVAVIALRHVPAGNAAVR